jgi:hypothetical protein
MIKSNLTLYLQNIRKTLALHIKSTSSLKWTIKIFRQHSRLKVFKTANLISIRTLVRHSTTECANTGYKRTIPQTTFIGLASASPVPEWSVFRLIVFDLTIVSVKLFLVGAINVTWFPTSRVQTRVAVSLFHYIQDVLL